MFQLKHYLDAALFVSAVIFLTLTIIEFRLHRINGKFSSVSAGHFIILSWVIPEFLLLALMLGAVLLDAKNSRDAAVGVFLLFPFYLLLVAVINTALFPLRNRSANVLYLAGLIAPVLLSVFFAAY